MIKFVHNHIYVVCSFVLALIFSFFIVTQIDQVKAEAPYLTIDKVTTDVDKQIASHAYYLGLKDCASRGKYNGKEDGTTSAVVGDSLDEIFAGQKDLISVGLIAEKVGATYTSVSVGDGIMMCETIAKAAFSMWGINSADKKTVLAELGYSQQTTYQCRYQGVDKIVASPLVITLPATIKGNPSLQSAQATAADAPPEYDGIISSLVELDRYCYNYDFNQGIGNVPISTNYPDDNPSNYIKEASNDIKEKYNYQEAQSKLWTTPSLSIAEFIRVHIYGLCKSKGSVSSECMATDPALGDGANYRLYKYYLENADTCGGKNYGLESELETNFPPEGVINIKYGSEGKYVKVTLIKDLIGNIGEYSYNLTQIKNINADEIKFPIEVGGITTCDDAAAKTSYFANIISKDMIINKKAPDYAAILGVTSLGDAVAVQPGIPDGGGAEGEDTKPTCGSQMTGGMGWIMCPVITGLAKLNDDVWSYVNDLLTVSPLAQTDSNGVTGVYKAWGVIRNIANVAFVIVFLIMIFSQLSSAGISNYGIKKLLPRLVIGAILVNISFLIIQIAVDLSNVVGSSLYDLLVSIIPAWHPDFISMIEQATIVAGAGAAAGSVALVVVFTGGITTALWLLLPVLAMAALGLIAALLTLIFRKAAIIVLAILAPLAIVASLLPNTESWYKKWKDEFIQMLMLFPLAAVVFGGSQFAAGVIISQNTHDWFNNLIAIIIVIMPLFSLPFLAKNSGKIVGAAGKALTDLANKAKSPMTKWTGERADRAKDRENNAAMNGSNENPYRYARKTYLQSKAKRDYAAQTQKGEFSRSQSKFIAAEVENNDKYRKNLAKGSGEGADMRAEAAAINIQAELETKEVKAAGAVIEHMDLSVPQKKALARGEEVTAANGKTLSGKDENVREAAITSAVAAGTVGDVEDIIQSSGRDVMNADGTVKTKGMTKRQRHALVSSMISSGIPAKATHLGGQTLGDIEQGNLDWEMRTDAEGQIVKDADGNGIRERERSIEDGLDSVTVRAIHTGKYSAEKIAGNEVDSLKRVKKVLSGPTRVPRPTGDESSKLIAQVIKARDDPRIGSTITEGQRTVIDQILPRPQADNEDGAGI